MIELPLTGPAWVFFILAVLILAAPLIAERVRLPGVIGLVLAGLIVGPQGLGLLDRAGTIEQLGGFGLLYLMFLAGLELDLATLRADRRRPVIFGLLTFAIPMALGTSSALLLGFGGFASVLIGSLWASHTLVTYPIVRRSGIVADGSVAATVGATVITDTLALIVLAVVARSFVGGGGLGFLATLLPGLALLALGGLWALPRLARWFFVGIGQDRTLRFLFVLAAFLGASVLAEVVGIEGIVGAFLAGLALNSLIPNGGALMQRIEFVGSALLIPIFLISVGMLVDVGVVLDPDTLWLSLVFIGVATVSKLIAAEVAGLIFGFSRSQIGVMFALSNAQAAATLAATIVGFEIGLFDERVVNAVLIVILVTVSVASWTAARSAPKVPVPTPPSDRLGRMVLAPVSHPDTAAKIVRLATWVAQADSGQLVPLHVVTVPEPERVRSAEPLLRLAESAAARLGDEVEAAIRVDRSVASGVVNTVVERDASLVLLGWKGALTTRERVFGSLLEDVVDRVPCVVAACWLPTTEHVRLVLLLEEAVVADFALTAALCRRLSRGSGLGVTVIGDMETTERDPGWSFQRGSPDAESLSRLLGPGDLVLLSANPLRSVMNPLAIDLAEAGLGIGLVVVHPPTPSLDIGVPGIFAGA